ncbi:MAG: hypothetical protein JWN70_2584 [Planctomycetaceae bacterium]|nr:hypothetical protein [Planctomycetaceae bacterium]
MGKLFFGGDRALQLQYIGHGISVVWSTLPNEERGSAVGTIEQRSFGYRAYSSLAPSVFIQEVGTHASKELALAAFTEWWERNVQ